VELIEHQFEPRSRQAFLKLVVDEKSAQQVAAELGMSKGAVYTVKSRVLARLRQEFGDLLEEGLAHVFPESPLACPAPQQLEAFQLGKLPDLLAASIAAHLEDCPSCLERLDQLPEPDDALWGRPEEDRASSRPFLSRHSAVR